MNSALPWVAVVTKWAKLVPCERRPAVGHAHTSHAPTGAGEGAHHGERLVAAVAVEHLGQVGVLQLGMGKAKYGEEECAAERSHRPLEALGSYS